MWQIWLIIAVFFLIVEILTIGFLVFWFALGAIFAMITSFFVDNVIIQTTVFIVSSTLFLFGTKPFVNKLTKKDNNVKTNVYSVENKTGIVTVAINPSSSKGQVRIGEETWSAKSYNDTFIPKGSEVAIEKVDGVKVVVRQI